MNRRVILFSTTVLLLGIVACSNNTVPNSSIAPSVTPTESAPAVSSASPSATPLPPSPAATEKAAPNEGSKETEIVKTYRMNKAYRIVPIDMERTESKVVLLTFDDGPKDKEILAPMLDALDKHNAKAIFFVNGYRVKANPELLKELDHRKQVIGNHSWDHIELKKENEQSVKEQIEKVQSLVKELTGKTPVFFRPPFASANDSVRMIAKDNGLLFMTWSNGSLDWDLNKVAMDKRPQAVIDNVMEQLHEGSNILMHELPWTAEALDNLLTQIEQKGYSFVDPNAIDTEL
ncbi:polysaccharide deacetylase family protein [Cohnella sp.]|uniref:polysaccharide deacetylase family protein n=1 Tax=Cohnella sp. TaxID=1883426 RepID=UPI003561520F